MDDSAAVAIFWSDAGIHPEHDFHKVHYGYSLAVECTLVVHSLLRSIECIRLRPLHYGLNHFRIT